MPKITTHLWFDQEAKEAAKFYTAIFPDSSIRGSYELHDTPSGSVDVVTINLMGSEFTLISAGPLFKFNPSVSFMVSCDSPEEVEKYWRKLSPGGKALMELGSYPFSEKYGWLEDKYGLSWQLIYTKDKIKQRITPAIMFVGKAAGKAEEAIKFYVSVFRDAKVGEIFRYAQGQEPEKKGTIAHASFQLEGQQFIAMDSANKHDFFFNEAISFMVNCANQKEIDYYWEKLSADPQAEQCGWLKDRYGLSWQVVAAGMEKMMETSDREKIDRVTQAFLPMKKMDIAKLEAAFKG